MALIKEKGQITSISEVNSREGKNGNVYSNLTLVLKIFGYQNSYRELALNVGGDRINNVLEFQVGQNVEVGYSVSSRYWEKGDKWFTYADLHTIEATGYKKPSPKAEVAAPKSEPIEVAVEEGKDDLPF